MAHWIHAVRMAGLPRAVPRDVPLLICPNHTSWWDGFLVKRLFAAIRPDATLLTIMLDEELGLHPVLRPLGAIGIRPGSLGSIRATVRTVKAARSREPEIGVVFFPQGKLWPSFRRPLGFRPGVHLFHEAMAPAKILPVGIHFEPGVGPAPIAYLSTGTPIDPFDSGGRAHTLQRLEAAVEAELDAIHHFLAQHGEDEETHWPTRDTPLPRAPAPGAGVAHVAPHPEAIARMP